MNILKGVKLLYYCLDVVIGFILREKNVEIVRITIHYTLYHEFKQNISDSSL